jgi:hypothetical protein
MAPVARQIETVRLPDSAWQQIIPLSTYIDSDFALASAIMESLRESGRTPNLGCQKVG